MQLGLFYNPTAHSSRAETSNIETRQNVIGLLTSSHYYRLQELSIGIS